MTSTYGEPPSLRASVVRMGLPYAASMFIGTLYAPIDLWCAARLGASPVVAISFAAPLFFVLMAFSSGLSQAATALIARQLGAGETGEARLTWTHAVALAVAVGGLLTLMGLWGAPYLLAAQGADGEVLRLAQDFAAVLFGGAAAFLLVATVNAALVAEGDARPNFWFLAAGGVANLAQLRPDAALGRRRHRRVHGDRPGGRDNRPPPGRPPPRLAFARPGPVAGGDLRGAPAPSLA